MEISKKTLNTYHDTGNLPGGNGAHYSVQLLEKARADTVLKELGSQLSGLSETDAEIRWFNPQQGLPNWADPKCKKLACLIHENGQNRLYLMFNAGTEETDFGLPPLPLRYRWRLAADTSRSAPQDLSAAEEETLLDNSMTYHLEACSSAILLARKQKSTLGGGSV